jgi:outer membrane protein OmpA-like peptidoglycan-associated protein
MKRILFLLIAANGALSVAAQTSGSDNSATKHPHRYYKPDSLLCRWVIDANFVGGVLTNDYKVANTSGNYTNGINNNTGTLKFSNGMTYGGDAQIGYFFGKKAHFGIGTGFMYLYQTGDATLKGFRVEFQNTEGSSNNLTFRQIITADRDIKESLTTTNMNIPLVLKYKDRFSRRFGFTADAGILYNIQEKNSYKTNAMFDYEGIYKYNTDGTAVYDNSPTPASTDFLLTKQHYLATAGNTQSNMAQYFANEYAAGHNVGLNVTPNSNKGTTNYLTGSVGFLVQPSLNYFLSDNLALNIGGYYMFQPFNNSVPSGYRVTDKVGSYNSITNSVSSTNAQSYGGNIGLRWFFGKPKDSDGDGIPDKKDKCPHVFGLKQFDGCPDSDGDGIPDAQDSCVDVPGTAQFHGCPDSDGDGIPDKEDSCVYQPGPIQFHGCPDSDGDGIPDKFDKCPNQPGPIANNGCPYDTVKPAPPAPRHPEVDPTTPILFDFGQATIHESSYDILEEAAMELRNNSDAYLIIDGHTDNVGSPSMNRVLSYKRAEAVKQYLKEMGISEKRLITVGHGEDSPVAPNSTDEGRAKNRRATMTIKHGKEE